MNLNFSAYRLIKKNTGVNSRDSSSYQEGVLLKYTQGPDWGVADLCPHPELGDADWRTEVRERGPLFLRAMELALEDMLARKRGVSLLSATLVRNNYLVTDYRVTDLNHEIYRGQTVKIKCDRQVEEVAARLNALTIPVRLRLDFNSCLDAELYMRFLQTLSEAARARIEYVEDPTPVCGEWSGWNARVPLAFDFQKTEYRTELADFQIIKPSRRRLPSDLERVTLTSAMDHPVGLAHGLRLAQERARTDSGFLTLSLYEDTPFHRYFDQRENLLGFSAEARNDAGIGMSEELQRLVWSEL